jgi:hypothetical protein
VSVQIRSGWLYGSLPDDTGREWPIKRFPQVSARGPLASEHVNLILHTTETNGYVETLRYPSQWQCGEGIIGQHIKLGYSGDAVNDWDQWAQQIEMVGWSQLGLWLPEEPTLGPTVALTAWLYQTGRIKTGLKRPTSAWPTVLDRGPQASESYYRRHANLWPGIAGVYGHVDIPSNKHWDPGSFNYPAFFRRVEAALSGGNDDVGFAEFQEGWKAHSSGLTKNPEWPADKRFGWQARDDAVENPRAVPGPVGPQGPKGEKGDSAELPAGSRLRVE